MYKSWRRDGNPGIPLQQAADLDDIRRVRRSCNLGARLLHRRQHLPFEPRVSPLSHGNRHGCSLIYCQGHQRATDSQVCSDVVRASRRCERGGGHLLGTDLEHDVDVEAVQQEALRLDVLRQRGAGCQRAGLQGRQGAELSNALSACCGSLLQTVRTRARRSALHALFPTTGERRSVNCGHCSA